MKNRLFLAALALLIGGVAQAATEFQDGQSLYYWRQGLLIGGMYGPSDTTAVGKVLRTTTDGYLKVQSMNEPTDLNTVTPVASGITLYPLNASDTGTHPNNYATSFFSISRFRNYQVHVDWADSAKTAATLDSTCFEIFPIGKMSTTNDGYDYFISLGGQPQTRATYATTASQSFWSSGQTVMHALLLGIFTPVTPGALVVGPGIAPGTTVASTSNNDSTLTLSKATSQGGNGATFYNLALGEAAQDTTIAGWCIGSPSAGFFSSAASAMDKHVPTRMYRNWGTAAQAVVDARKITAVSFPLAMRDGTPIYEDIIGFYVVNRAFAVGSSGGNVLHSLTISLVEKAN